jgi:putative ABC transport system substrate-binding protein
VVPLADQGSSRRNQWLRAAERAAGVGHIGGDPVKLGLAASYRRPGGNATGISILTDTLEPKRLDIPQTYPRGMATPGFGIV